jgi:hypothetical protein
MRQKITAYLLLTLVVFASSGITLRKMVCVASGAVTLSLTEFDCCSTEIAGKEILSAKCCDFGQISTTTDNAISTEHIASVKTAEGNIAFNPMIYRVFLKNAISGFPTCHAPPLITLPQREKICVFLI